jgi:lysophospholipase L1-like esterase
MRPGDYLIIQFGHNDEKYTDVKKFPDPLGMFKTNLVGYVNEARARHATPILATPIARRRFDKDGNFQSSHGSYPDVVRAVARELAVPLLELTDRTEAELKKLGPQRSAAWFDQIPPGEFARLPDGLKDDTHLNAYGASRVCDLAAAEISTAVPELAKLLKAPK